jgi:hypothetical protein
MPSRIGYKRWHATHFNPLESGFNSTRDLHAGQTRISRRSGLIAIGSNFSVYQLMHVPQLAGQWNQDMANLSDIEKLFSTLSRGEKAQVLKWAARDLGDDFLGIDSRPDVCGGEPCIASSNSTGAGLQITQVLSSALLIRISRPGAAEFPTPL